MPEQAKSELQHIVDEITGYRRRTRVYYIAVSFVAVLAIAIGVLVFFLNRHDNTTQNAISEQIHQSQLDNCATANRNRIKDEQLWRTFIKLVAPHPDANARAIEAQFFPILHAKDTPVNCVKVYPPLK
jgi:hypothetical protein